MSDAKALEIQVRQSVGQPVRPEAEADEELKLLALQGLQHSDPDQAVPMLEKILQGPQSPRLKERALFVLAQSNSAPCAPGADHRRPRRLQSRPAAPRDPISRRARQPREPRRCWRRSMSRRPTSTSSGASCARSACPVIARVSSRRDERNHPGTARRSGAATRRHGRARRAVAALSEGNDRRRSRSRSCRRCSSAATRRA